jgi:hypothetical protein
MSEPTRSNEDVARQWTARIATDLFGVLACYQTVADDGTLFFRFIALRAVGGVLETLMRKLLADEPMRAQADCAEILAALGATLKPPRVH